MAINPDILLGVPPFSLLERKPHAGMDLLTMLGRQVHAAQELVRTRSDLDYDVNRRAAAEIQGLARKLNLLEDKVDDLTELLPRHAR